MTKKTISATDAENLFFEKLDKYDIGNKLYEFAMSIKESIIDDINAESEVVDENGEIIDGEDDTEWYDDIENESLVAIFDKISDALSLFN